MKHVLFLCSANYYRSRFAEHLFNRLAQDEDLPWRADSRGLAVDRWSDLRGFSSYTQEGLAERGIAIDAEPRNPLHLTLADLTQADLVIALKEAEHRAMMAAQFPLMADQIEYWRVDDIDCAGPDEALPALEEEVRDLIARLRKEETAAAA